MYRRSMRWPAVGLALAALTLSACSAIPKRPVHSEPPPAYAAAAKRSEWAQFFWQQGKQCRLVATTPAQRVAGQWHSTQETTTATIVSTWASSDGESYVVAQNRRSVLTTRPAADAHAKARAKQPAKSYVSTRQTRTLYTITRDGRLEIAPQSDQVGKAIVTFEDAVTYPSPATLRAGHVYTQTVHGTLGSTDPAVSTLFQQFSSDGSPDVRVVYTVHMQAHPVTQPIVTPVGRYTDVFALDYSIASFHAVNMTGRLATVATTVFRSYTTSSTTWYARGVGPVSSTATNGGVTTVQYLSGCSLAVA